GQLGFRRVLRPGAVDREGVSRQRGRMGADRLRVQRGVLRGRPCGVPCALLAIAPSAIVIAVGTCITGAGLMLGNAIWETTLQRQIPRHLLSRVTAYDWFASLALVPIGNAIVGPIALTIGFDATLWGAFTIITSMGLVALSMKSI